jgi:hypothetical protein
VEDDKPEQLAIWLADRKERRFGSLLLDAKATAAAYNDYHATQVRWGSPPDAKAMAALVPVVLTWLSGRIAQDLPVAVSIALKDPDRQIGSTADGVKASAKAWRRASIGLSRLRFDALLDLPVSSLIPDRPKLQVERDLVPGEDLSFGDYMVGALLAEDGTAWNAIQKALKPKFKRGRKRKISSEDLARLDATTQEIQDAVKAKKDGRRPNPEIIQRLKDAGLRGVTLKTAAKASRKLATDLVARETGKKRSTLDHRSRNRRRSTTRS